MIVTLDLEAHRRAVTEVEHARILTGALQDPFTRGRKSFEKESRVLVAAVLRPEEREHRQLEVVGLPPEQVDDAREFPVGQSERAVDGLFGDLRQVIQCRREAGRRSPRSEER
jgi:hypothetical protein